MRTQQDYETQPTLAVFDSAESASSAVDAVRTLRADIASIDRVRLGPGAYELDDPGVRQAVGGAWRGALWGLVIGLILGVALAFAIGTTSPQVLFWFAITGAGLGLMIGGFVGAITHARFTNATAGRITVAAGQPAELVAVYTGGPDPRVRGTLKREGARGFLDPTTPATREALLGRSPTLEAERASRAA